jgi:hypothetical protein
MQAGTPKGTIAMTVFSAISLLDTWAN